LLVTRQMRLVLAIALCAGCFDVTGDGAGDQVSAGSGTGDCPGGGTCSPQTPHGLTFAGVQLAFGAFPPGADTEHANIATGGTDLIVLEEDDAPFSRPFAAAVDDPAALTIAATSGSTVTLVGGTGTTELEITDPATGLLYDRYAYASSRLVTAAAVPEDVLVSAPDWLTTTAPTFAFWPGDLEVTIALENVGGSNRLVDTSLVLALAGATQLDWQTLSIPGATPGTYAIAATSAGGDGTAAPLVVVDHADAITPLITTGGLACFEAATGGAFVVGIPWTFTIAGAPAPSAGPSFENCVSPPLGEPNFTVTASAGGQSLTADVTQ
jgi:hypothetical protein